MMTTDEELRQAADSLSESVVVGGCGSGGRAAAAAIDHDGVATADTEATPEAAILAVDASQFLDGSSPELPTIPDAPVRLAVVTIPDRPTAGERALIEDLSTAVGTVVLAPGRGSDDLTRAVTALVSIVRDAGVVNVDLADVETVFRSTDLAALCLGDDPSGGTAPAVRNALDSLAGGLETDPATGAIVDLVGPSDMSVTDVSEAVSTVRSYVGPDAHVIWGGTVDDRIRGIEVRLVLAGVRRHGSVRAIAVRGAERHFRRTRSATARCRRVTAVGSPAFRSGCGTDRYRSTSGAGRGGSRPPIRRRSVAAMGEPFADD